MFKKIIITGLIIFPSLTFASTYGSNFLTGGTCNTDSVYENNTATYGCTKVFDQNTATSWESGNSSLPHWISYDTGEGITKYFDKITLTTDTDGSDTSVKTLTIQGSNDNTNWTLIATTSWTNGNETSYTADQYTTSTAQYRYFRFYATDKWWTLGWYGIKEISAYECTDCHTSTSTTSSSTITTNTGNFMSPELDQLLIYILEGLVIVAVAWGAYKFYKS